jgi:hypothetical protein
MRWFVDPWSPSYGSAFEAADGPRAESSAALDLDVEVPADSWAPIAAPPDLRAPDTVLLVDGVRRTDALLWSNEGDGTSFAGLAASFAAGVVRCDLRSGTADLPSPPRVKRGLFTASPTATGLTNGGVRYEVHKVTRGEPAELQAAVQGPLTELEVEVATAARSAGDGDRGDLLIVDGPLRGRQHLPRTIGYIKAHRKQYLPANQSTVVVALAPGQRSPVFRLGTSWHRHTWYLRLPGPPGAPWTGMVRVECSADLPATSAIALADLSTVTLPRFASAAYKDPRAPQNLVPIGGLERRLRALLGDARLLHRCLTSAARV